MLLLIRESHSSASCAIGMLKGACWSRVKDHMSSWLPILGPDGALLDDGSGRLA